MRLPHGAFFLLAVLIAPAAQAQPRQCSFAEVFNPVGWEIPGLSGSKIVRSDIRYETNAPGDVFMDTLDPDGARAVLLLLMCDSNHVGRLEAREQPIAIKTLIRFRWGQRVFGYKVVADWADVQSGKWVPVGMTEILVYYDVDGSGKFKVRRGAELFKLEVPEWVKIHAQDGPRKE
jgi:hypothetical protein